MEPIIIEEKWDDQVIEIAQKFNKYVKKHSMRMISFYLDKAFDIMADDTNESQYDAAYFLKRVRNLNPKLISSYMSALIDAKTEKEILSKEEYIVPDYSKYPVSKSLEESFINAMIEDDSASSHTEEENDPHVVETSDNEDEPVVTTSDDIGSKPQQQRKPKKVEKEEERNNSEKYQGQEGPPPEEKTQKSQQSSESNIINWNIEKLIKFRIIKNLERIKYEQIESPIKKCALGDGVFDKKEDTIWQCKECKTAYHENCAKITAIFDGKCKICDAPFYREEKKE
ncbi:MAG: hypothetical protein ACOC44_12260 [Promethearchaeia archaeon]